MNRIRPNLLALLGPLIGMTIAFCTPLYAARTPTGIDPSAEQRRLGQITGIVRRKRVREKYKTLITWIKTDPSSRVQYGCANALGKYVAPEVRDALLMSLKDKQITDSRRTAIWLALEGQARVIEDKHIRDLIATKDESDLGWAILLAGRLSKLSQETREKLLKHLGSTNHHTRTKVVVFIGMELGTDSRVTRARRVSQQVRTGHIELLQKVIRKETKKQVKRLAVIVFAKTGEKDGLQYLMEMVEEDYQELKRKGKSMNLLAGTMSTLHRITKKSFGFSRARNGEEREAAVKAWLNWWKSEKDRNKSPQ